jgi:hypothetical protein
MRLTSIIFVLAAIITAACTSSNSSSSEQAVTDQGCQVNVVDPRACDPADTKKTTVCHIPPGNPANAHTICVGNDAVPAHLDHGDFVGTCICEGSGSDGSGDGSGSNTGSDTPSQF